MSYRPEGWKNPHIGAYTGGQREWRQQRAYEAGADAMLEGLKARGIHFKRANADNLGVVIPFLDAVDTGTLIFILDEEAP